MNLVIILLALVIYRYTNVGVVLKRYTWIDKYFTLIDGLWGRLSLNSGTSGAILLCLPIAVIVFLLYCFFYNLFAGLIGALFALLVLLYCLDDTEIKAKLQDYFAALLANQVESAREHAETFTGEEASKEQKFLLRQMTCAVFQRALHSLFSPIFWFLILGPAGAIFYYSIYMLATFSARDDSKFTAYAAGSVWVRQLLDWIPVRLLALSYALVGQFSSTFKYLVKNVLAGIDKADNIAADSGLIALNYELSESTDNDVSENRAAIDLINNTVVVWLVVIALMTIVAWVA